NKLPISIRAGFYFVSFFSMRPLVLGSGQKRQIGTEKPLTYASFGQTSLKAKVKFRFFPIRMKRNKPTNICVQKHIKTRGESALLSAYFAHRT
ncbi:MAG: hypothetical protein LPD71_15270, partial [Shewanella sp.]|nr:hypothetical protein [Shewanella sp.]